MNDIEKIIEENILGAKKIFNEQIKNADDYVEKEKELGFLTKKGEVDIPFPNEDAIKRMDQLPFVLWLRKEPGFIAATEKLAKDKPNIVNRTNVEIIDKYMRQHTLERLCAFHVRLFTGNEAVLEQAVVHKEDHVVATVAVQTLLNIFDKGSLLFENGAKQLVAESLLRGFLKSSGHNVFSSKKIHPSLFRQVFTKFIAQALFRTYEKITTRLAVEVALDISNIFFSDVMDKRDLERIIKEISSIIDDENAFLKKSILQLLNEEAFLPALTTF